MSAVVELYTYDDYVKWEGDWELIDGRPLAMAPAPMRKHQSLASKLITQIENQLEEECEECEVLPEIDYKISEDTILRPDIVLTCDETGEAYLVKAPMIVIEIISKSTAKRDEKYKYEIYEEEKVPYYVLVYPDDLKAKIFKLTSKGYDKEGDFTTQKYHFKDIKCEVELDFEKVFKRYRK